MIFKKFSFGILCIWLLASLGLLAWGIWPRALEARHLVVPGFGILSLEWNPENRTGDITVVELTLVTQNEESLTFAPQSMEIANYYPIFRQPGVKDEKNEGKLVEARLEIPAVDMKPRNTVGQSFQPGDEVVFFWNVNSHIEGEFQGRIWLYTGNQSQSGNTGNRNPIAVQSVDLQWRNLFGLSGVAARYMGSFGLISGILLSLLLWLRVRQADIPDIEGS